ncbi:MAG: NAD-dependent epimerase/dehydratase family protein [Candidatus Omnitrophica bacterium]|nr:NAD-dependent epimerase/dehydratase family protein [Candidatus Omnitrophota bacterium]
MRVLVTGAGGLIGYESVRFFLEKGAIVVGIDNNMRRYFFGPGGDTTANIEYLGSLGGNFANTSSDIRDRAGMMDLFRDKGPFDLVIHTAAQPSHDWAAREPFTDFDVNAVGTLNLLEAYRKYSPEGVFILCSTNKVYGDKPNMVELVEEEKRFSYGVCQKMAGVSLEGINEEMSIDACTHSLFGASKAAGDILAQEYGRYFGLNTGAFRGGCLTGPQHSAVELHGYLAYIIDCAIKRKKYTIFGYKGKQVRDQIHSYDVVTAFYEFYKNPGKGAVYNIGGCRENSVSILETVEILEKKYGLKVEYDYNDKHRIGDHLCYYSDMSRFRKDYPGWKITVGLDKIFDGIVEDRTRKA